MTKTIKWGYFMILACIIIPFGIQWGKGVTIPTKKALLPPELHKFAEPDTQLLDTLLAHNLWSKDHSQVKEASKQDKKKPAQTTSQAKKWTLQGITASQTPNARIEVFVDSQQITLYRDDKLPDGWVLTKILSDGIVIQQQKKIKHVYLFGKQ